MVRLRRHTADQARAPLDVFCDELIIKFGADTTDDIALLALRPTPPARAARPDRAGVRDNGING